MPPLHALYPIAGIRQVEQAASQDLPPDTLMRRAGRAAANAALALLSGDRNNVLVLAGPGNNGGDALEAASHLAQAGLQVVVLLFGQAEQYSHEAQRALQQAQAACLQIECERAIFSSVIAATNWDLVMDGLFGIGLVRPLGGDFLSAVEAINRLRCPVLALDIPSGLDADTGNIVGASGSAVHATHTLTFLADKPGLHTCEGRDYAGTVEVDALHIPDHYFPPAYAQLNHVGLFSHALFQRAHNSHKGSFGDVAVIGGAAGMTGAVILAARTAAKCGAGRVFAAFIESAPAYDSGQPELMCRPAAALELTDRTLVVGPGLGSSVAARVMLEKALVASGGVVLDADALNMLAAAPALQQLARQHTGAVLLTPHPLEAARLLDTCVTQVQADRLSAARQLAQQFNAVVILKGSGTIIAHPNGPLVVNANGNPGLASAGSGDVLAGLCGALLAQHWPVWEAALAAVWLHAQASDVLVGHGQGPIGLTAGELIMEIRHAINQLANRTANPYRHN